MSCNNKHDFPFATTVVGEVKDSFMASVGFENGKYLKLGNVLTVAQIGGHAYHGEWENVAQDVGVWAATTAIALAIAPVSVPAILATGVLTLSVNYSLNKIIDGLQCPPDEPNPDPTTPFLPDPNGDVKNYTAICIIWLKLVLHPNLHHRHTIQPRLEYKRHIPT